MLNTREIILERISMSDINWRDISEDQSIFDEENRNREILIETSDNHSMHFSNARYILSYPYPYIDGSIQQPVARYAYID
jgi:hypothetical protein